MGGRPRTDDDTGLITSRAMTIHTTRGAMPLRAVSPQALADAQADTLEFARIANGFILEPAPFDPAKLPDTWRQSGRCHDTD